MRKSQWRGNKAQLAIRNMLLSRHNKIGEIVTTEAKYLAPVDEGFLRNSIHYLVEPKRNTISTFVGVENVVYAGIQEFGGEITPVEAKLLTVPVHPSAKGRKASDFPDLFMINRKSKFPLLVRKSGGGRSQKLDIMFVLVPKVKIPT